MKLILIDDDLLVTTSLKIILEAEPSIQVAAVGNSGAQAEALYEEHQPDILLMDIRMGEMDGLEASRRVLARWPEARILLLTTFSDDEYIVKALRLGAKGYLLKQDYEQLVPALQAVYLGQTVFGSDIVRKLPELLREKNSFDWEQYEISEKELAIIRGVAEGLSNKEIAEELYLGEGTVRNYLSTILNKLQLRDRTQLAVFYLSGDTARFRK